MVANCDQERLGLGSISSNSVSRKLATSMVWSCLFLRLSADRLHRKALETRSETKWLKGTKRTISCPRNPATCSHLDHGQEKLENFLSHLDIPKVEEDP